MVTENTADRIKAGPTKSFFIDTLVKDIQLIPAVVDLIDNSVDGALRVRQHGGSFEDLYIRLVVKSDRFVIEDNCGGIPFKTARDYAFRFGRPEGTPTVNHSVGQFGVGMKRALFKLGTRFRIESVSDTHRFVVEVDVDEWKTDDEDWHFDWTELETLDPPPPAEERGTTITVRELHPSVSEDLGEAWFRSSLSQAISRSHRVNMADGLSITLNGVPLQFDLARLLTDADMSPGYSEHTFDGVSVRIYAGVGRSSPTEAGWYVFCNGRQVLGADRTALTGWGGKGGVNIPKFHNQYARFRGYAFFDADDASLLPWNTTKTGVDEDSDVYRTARVEMVRLMRPVISFLNQVDQEKDQIGSDDVGPLEEALGSAVETPLIEIASTAFTPPKPRKEKPSKGPALARIQYSRPKSLVIAARKALRATTYKEVGEKTFDYFIELEDIEGDDG